MNSTYQLSLQPTLGLAGQHIRVHIFITTVFAWQFKALGWRFAVGVDVWTRDGVAGQSTQPEARQQVIDWLATGLLRRLGRYVHPAGRDRFG
ncbi:MAG: hypothetical protein HY270_24520 [Deltaproteobacteria bacterium]|nr:hypothetical protein [Deltaproteobacteria bacterium]